MLSLRFKILAVAATLILLSQIGTVVTVLVTANRDVSARATLALEAGSEIFQKTNQSRTAQFGNTVSALAADYGFKRAIATDQSRAPGRGRYCAAIRHRRAIDRIDRGRDKNQSPIPKVSRPGPR